MPSESASSGQKPMRAAEAILYLQMREPSPRATGMDDNSFIRTLIFLKDRTGCGMYHAEVSTTCDGQQHIPADAAVAAILEGCFR